MTGCGCAIHRGPSHTWGCEGLPPFRTQSGHVAGHRPAREDGVVQLRARPEQSPRVAKLPGAGPREDPCTYGRRSGRRR
jgi:hypothetical protein